MRITPILAAALAFAGAAVAQPAAAERSLAPVVTLGAPTGTTANADQYRDRYDRRYDRYGYRDRNRARYYRGGYRRGRLVCRTYWRHHRSYRRCWRR